MPVVGDEPAMPGMGRLEVVASSRAEGIELSCDIAW
jgi:hypothetical protein